MGERGPIGLTDAEKKRRGTHRPHRSKPATPRPASGNVEPPDWWDADSPAREMWDRTAPELVRLGLLSEMEQGLFTIYCSSWEEWLIAMRAIETEGAVYTTSRGVKRVSPWMTVADKAAKRMLSIAAEYGLTPRSRQRIRIEINEPERDNPWRLLRPTNPFDELTGPADRDENDQTES